MKYAFVTLLLLLPIVMGTACDQSSRLPADGKDNYIPEHTDSMKNTLKIKIGSKEFAATLFDNPTTGAFKSMLPLTINMTELNGNEKYFDLPDALPTNPSKPGKINTGDVLLWGSNTLVLFYETFSTSYSYTKLGKVDDPTGLATALGSGSVTVTIELK
jgi:hypothetical protein